MPCSSINWLPHLVQLYVLYTKKENRCGTNPLKVQNPGVRTHRLLKCCDKFQCDAFLTFLSDNVCNDDVLMPVFCSRSDVTNNVWLSFKNYVNR